MCVKEFLGYTCGHCSMPYIKKCPLTASNPVYPPCKYLAERPIYTNDFCHPCSRVIWNAKILEEEEEHRLRHLKGDHCCEVIFDGEDREKRLRMRGTKSKGKMAVKGRSGGACVGAGEGSGSGARTPGHGHAGNNVQYSFVNPGHGRGISSAGASSSVGSHGGISGSARDGWEPEAQAAAYEYVGYTIDDQSRPTTVHGTPELGYGIAAVGDYYPKQSLWEGQLTIDQAGAGMKWYPEQSHAVHLRQSQNVQQLPPISHHHRHSYYNWAPSVRSKTRSLPGTDRLAFIQPVLEMAGPKEEKKTEEVNTGAIQVDKSHAEASEPAKQLVEEPKQPPVVNSDMAASKRD